MNRRIMGVVLTVFLFLQKGFNRLTFCSIMLKFMAGEWRPMLLAETAQFMSLPALGLGAHQLFAPTQSC
ncbi:hypothetical protein [Methylobacter sp. BBA5.1]|uniref:hypothetical protein n=1 Tax=Methylobacter sp. BBA5.1 TaxID=1495064 RepID=UPI000ADB8D95|nr:hypothetical protein [Methylobacter sp. BBA5.1]